MSMEAPTSPTTLTPASAPCAEAAAPPPSAIRAALRTAAILLAFVSVFTALLSGVYLLASPIIKESSGSAKILRLAHEILPPSAYDNALLKDTVEIPATSALGQNEPTLAYRARKDGQPVALVLQAAAPDGYAGRIHLLLVVAPDGALFGVRVVQHRETPGLGDYIDPKKDRNKKRPWIGQFAGANPVTESEGDWRVKKDGGRFDAMAGATVSPRAVVKAVRQAALYVARNRETLFKP